MPEEALKAFMEATENLVKSGIAEMALNVGDRLPDFTLPNAKGEAVSSAELLKSGPLVINFYRGGWCPYCNLELNALQKAVPQIDALGTRLVAISPELPDKSLSTAEKNSLTFEVLSDKGNAVSKTFGLVFALAEELLQGKQRVVTSTTTKVRHREAHRSPCVVFTDSEPFWKDKLNEGLALFNHAKIVTRLFFESIEAIL